MRNTVKMTRKSLVSMAAVTAAALAMAAVPATASADDTATTPEGYEQYLVTQVELGDSDAQQTLDEYQTLSDSEKEQFVTYLDDPERGQELGDFLSDATDVDSINEEAYETELRKETEGGDVVLEATSGIEEVETAPTTDEELSDPSARYYDRSAWYSVSDKIMGVTVTTVKIGVNYRTTSSRVTKVYSGWASHKNRVPFLEYSHGIVSKWISANPGNNAHAETIWQGEWKGIAWDGRQRIWADQDGFKGGYLK
ncbi:hypothetical protein AQJ84_39750 [Streptomyces resistomycificus]|uniref:Uncharacterized protein n=3 Tax=Streptomyces resistomycificus TaxID=67356 RepID=A0A0L8L148_9ACTN|nr:hypothetical protein ADK37_29535 [Streptomyces resistomycificus]KUN90470.1 hypothetical protein AQJ84_39750 [Streptomyces resistomycificus]